MNDCFCVLITSSIVTRNGFTVRNFTGVLIHTGYSNFIFKNFSEVLNVIFFIRRFSVRFEHVINFTRIFSGVLHALLPEKQFNWNLMLRLHCAINVKGALSGLRQFLADESPLKIMKNAFYFTSKALFTLKILNFLS